MKHIITLIVFLAIYIFSNIYLYTRGLQVVPVGNLRTIYTILFWTLTVSFVLGMVAEDAFPIWVSSGLQTVGGLWLFASLYLIVFVVFFDLLRVLNYFFHIFPSFIIENYKTAKLAAAGVALATVGIMFIAGNVRFQKPQTVNFEVKTNKNIAYSPKIVMVSDLHIGYTTRKKSIERYIQEINVQNPDIVLLCGDTFDRSMRPVISENLTRYISQIKAKKGIYAVLGNHEYYGDLERSIQGFKDSGITLLRDEIAEPYEGIIIAGRDDMTNPNRRPVEDLVAGMSDKFVVLMDHQPYNLEKAQNAGVDLQFSGHTHDGQVWPVNLITRKIYEKSHGLLEKGEAVFYVSSGLGIWGPKIRIGTVSELVVTQITSKKE